MCVAHKYQFDNMCVPHIFIGRPDPMEAILLAEEKLQLAAGLGEAKGRQNVDDALRFMHDEMVLTSPAWGTVARGKAQNAETLRRFFRDFPDYSVSLDGHVADDRHLVCWGVIRMTMAPGAYGLQANGRRIETPAFLRFTFKDGLIASEYFMVDLSAICAQSGVSADAVGAFIKAHRSPRAA
jgi:predicted ester cyclase